MMAWNDKTQAAAATDKLVLSWTRLENSDLYCGPSHAVQHSDSSIRFQQLVILKEINNIKSLYSNPCDNFREMLLSLNIKVKCEVITTRYIVEILLRYFVEMCWWKSFKVVKNLTVIL